MSKNHINLIKLCVGAENLEQLETWQADRAAASADPAGWRPEHVTRMWPKQADRVVSGGSLYWVIKGVVQARQPIEELREVIGADGIRRCGIVMSRELIRTVAAPRRPFQGWRYLKPEDSPADLPVARSQDDRLPPEMEDALAQMGLR